MDEDDADEAPAVEPRPRRAAPADAFGWRGWILVATLVVSLLVLPGVILALPAARAPISALGLTLRDAYLVLPLPAAILLAAVAVWSALAARRE